MTPTPTRIAYIMKRYPRLSETFILTEIATMEELGAELALFSLLQPEPPPHHPLVASIRAPLHHLPPDRRAKIRALGAAHAACAARAPLRYAHALGRLAYSAAQSRAPLGVVKQFLRAGFVADRCKRQGIDLIHAHFANAPAAVAWFAATMSGIPYSFTTHAKDLYLTSPRVLRRRIRGAQFVTTCTRYNVEHLRTITPQRDHAKLRLVYHGIDLARFSVRAAARAPKPEPLILSVGRLVPKKGFDDLIAACAILRDGGIPFRCEIVGEGPLRDEMEQDIARRGLAGQVHLKGAMTHADLIAFYREADIFALAPRIVADGDRDGIPNVIAEAMAIGVPVVSTAVSGIPELVQNSVTGMLVPPQSPDALAAALRGLLRDPQAGLRLAAQARAGIESGFNCRETTKALRDLMAGCACGAEHDHNHDDRGPGAALAAE